MDSSFPQRRRSRTTSGFTLLEVMIALVALTLSLQYFTQSFSSMARLEPAASDHATAVLATRDVLERVRGTPFVDVFAEFGPDATTGRPWNASAADLGLTGAVPEGLRTIVRLPTMGPLLREDIAAPRLGMPRDLNADGVIDALDHSGDYLVLPVRVISIWVETGLLRSYEITTLLAGPRTAP